MADTNNDHLMIRLHVYDTDMSVKIPRHDEALYRNTASHITDTVNAYAAYYKESKSDKELLYMALIDIALKYERELKRNDTKPYDDAMRQLTTEIEGVIGESQE